MRSKFICVFCFTFIFANCGSDDEQIDGTSLANITSGVSGNLQTMAESLVPDSLKFSRNNLRENDVCAGTDFFDCQPRLLELYIEIAKNALDSSSTVISNAGESLFKSVGIPKSRTCNTIITKDDDNFNKVAYCITSESKFSVLFFQNNTPSHYLSVNKENYTMQVHEEGKFVNIEATFESEADHEVSLQFKKEGCDPNDVQSPETIAIHVSKSGELAKGKAMLYLPRWISSPVTTPPTCTTTPGPSTSLAYYTNFIGNKASTTSAIYFSPVNVSEKSDISNYAVSNLCTTFPQVCTNGFALGDPNKVSDTYINNFCVENSTVTWNINCENSNEDISEGSYSANQYWLSPTELSTHTIELPASLE